MGIVTTAAIAFVIFLFLSAGFGVVSVVVANIIGLIVPSADGACARYIAGWRSKRGLRNRLLVVPLVITFVTFAVLAVIGLIDTARVRNRMTESTRLVVRTGGNCHRRPERERILLQVEGSDALRALAERISIGVSIPGVQCMCCGDMTFDLYRGNELHYSFSFHHGESIRLKDSVSGDKSLSSSSRRKLSEWLDQTGVTKAFDEFRRQERERQKAASEATQGNAQQEK